MNHPTPLIIVVDALDECDDHGRLCALSHAVTNVSQRPSPIRILLIEFLMKEEQDVFVGFLVSFGLNLVNRRRYPAKEQDNWALRPAGRIRSKHSDIFLGMGKWPSPHDID